jgi:hypothetical protein
MYSNLRYNANLLQFKYLPTTAEFFLAETAGKSGQELATLEGTDVHM